MYYELYKNVDGEFDLWDDYGASEVHKLADDAWRFGKMGIPVKVVLVKAGEDGEEDER